MTIELSEILMKFPKESQTFRSLYDFRKNINVKSFI